MIPSFLQDSKRAQDWADSVSGPGSDPIGLSRFAHQPDVCRDCGEEPNDCTCPRIDCARRSVCCDALPETGLTYLDGDWRGFCGKCGHGTRFYTDEELQEVLP